VLQRRRRPDLGQKPLRAQCCRELGVQHFDRDQAVVLRVACEIHDRHAATPDLTLDDVAAGERRGELGSDPHSRPSFLAERLELLRWGRGGEIDRAISSCQVLEFARRRCRLASLATLTHAR
jgi:hypothetical protein